MCQESKKKPGDLVSIRMLYHIKPTFSTSKSNPVWLLFYLLASRESLSPDQVQLKSFSPRSCRKRPLSPPPKSSSGKGPGGGAAMAAPPGSKPGIPASAFAASGGGAGPGSKPSNTLSRREELLKQLKAVEDAIARKRAKIPTK